MPTITFNSARSDIPEALVDQGFTHRQALAIYHQWIAPLDDNSRLAFLLKVLDGYYNITTQIGLHLLVTSQGW